MLLIKLKISYAILPNKNQYRPLVLHHGRSETIAVGVLLHFGYEVLEAVNLVSASRKMEVAKAAEQRQWLYEYAWKLRNV